MMKRVSSCFILLMALWMLSFSAPAPVAYTVDPAQSTLSWIGRKVVGEHKGTLSIASGTLLMKGKALAGGSFEIDMTSIANADVTNEGSRQRLVNHLKSDDFFSVEKHPKAKLVITSVSAKGKGNYVVVGDLTIKGITHEISFPASLRTAGNQLTANAKILVDRTRWEIRYRSGSFFENLGDKAIQDEFELNVELKALQEVTASKAN